MEADSVYFLGAVAALVAMLYLGPVLLRGRTKRKQDDAERQANEDAARQELENKARHEEEKREFGKLPRRERAQRDEFERRRKKQSGNQQSRQQGKKQNRHPNAIVHSLLPELDSDDQAIRLNATEQLLRSSADLNPPLIDVFRNSRFSYNQRIQVAAIVMKRGDAGFVSVMKDVFHETDAELDRLLQPAEVEKRRRLQETHASMMLSTEEGVRAPPPADVADQCSQFGTAILSMLSDAGHDLAGDTEHAVYDGNGDVENFYAELSMRCMDEHGTLIRVEFLTHFPDFEMRFVYSDGWSMVTGQRRGQYDIHFMSFGYAGEGTRYLNHFLEAAGFFVDADLIESLKAGDALVLHGSCVALIRGDTTVSEHEGFARFVLEESNDGTTFRVFSTSCEVLARAFLAQHTVAVDNSYLLVSTPAKHYGIDRNGELREPYELFNAFAGKL